MLARELGEKQQKQHLDREIRDMMSSLTRRLAPFQKKPTGGGGEDVEDEHGGFGIITMTGSNEGATMRGDLIDDLTSNHNKRYLNNNFQGVNNSIMVGGSYSAKDPGIHMDVEDLYKQHQGKHGKKGKKETYSGPSTTTTDHSS